MEILGKLIAGLGLFLSGLYLLRSALKQLTSRRLRILLSKWTGTVWQGSMIGGLLGAVVQSSPAVSFILAGLVSAGMIQLGQAIPVILWANPGTCLLVVLAFLNINILKLFILGIAGIAFAREKPARYPAVSQALFGVGLLFYGLIILKTGAVPLSEMEWFRSLFFHIQKSLWLSFLIGAAAAMIVQSSLTIMILTITFNQLGVLTPDQTIMAIYGAHVGSSTITWILALDLRGTAKQIVIVQISLNLVGAFIMVSLFYIEKYTGIPLIKAFVALLFNQIEQQMSAICILFNAIAALVLTILKTPLARFLQWLCPPTEEEEWSKVKFLHDQMLKNPETALELVQKEQSRLFVRFPLYIENARKNNPEEISSLLSIHKAFTTVSQEIETFLSEILKSCSIQQTTEQAMNIKNRQDLIKSFEQTLFDLIQMLLTWCTGKSDKTLKETFVEGLDFLILTASDAFEKNDMDSIDSILLVTEDRSELMQQMRKQILANNAELSSNDRMIFLQITSLYERTTWILGRIGLLLQQEKNI